MEVIGNSIQHPHDGPRDTAIATHPGNQNFRAGAGQESVNGTSLTEPPGRLAGLELALVGKSLLQIGRELGDLAVRRQTGDGAEEDLTFLGLQKRKGVAQFPRREESFEAGITQSQVHNQPVIFHRHNRGLHGAARAQVGR